MFVIRIAFENNRPLHVPRGQQCCNNLSLRWRSRAITGAPGAADDAARWACARDNATSSGARGGATPSRDVKVVQRLAGRKSALHTVDK